MEPDWSPESIRRLIYSVVDVICRCGIIFNHVITHLKLKDLSLHFFLHDPSSILRRRTLELGSGT